MKKPSPPGASEYGNSPVAFWGGGAALAAIAFIAQLPLYNRSLVPMDEGHLLAAAQAMAAGKLLYAEIHTGIFPGIYLIASALLETFGRDVVVLRWAAVAMNISIALSLYAIGRRMVAAHWSWLPPLLYLALIAVGFPVLSMFNYSTLAVAFGLLGLLFLLRYLEAGRTRDGILLGAFVAAAALTKQNFGALIFVALLAGLLAGRRESAIGDRGLALTLLPIAATGMLLAAATALYFAGQGALPALVDATIFSLAGSQFENFNNPIPPIFGSHPVGDARFTFLYTPPTVFNALIHGVPFAGLDTTPELRSLSIRASYGLPLAALVLAPALLFLTRRDEETARTRTAARSSALFAVIFAPGIFPSAIWSHLAFVMIPILLLFALIGDRVETILRRRQAKVAVQGWRILAAGLIGVALIIASRSAVSVMDFYPEPLGLERASLFVSERDRDLLRGAVDFIEKCSEPGEPTLALPDIPIIYFLADRPNPSPYDLAIPGNVDGGKIVEGAETAGVRCVVLNPRMYPEFAGLEVLFPGLSRYLASHFYTSREIWGGRTLWLGLSRKAP